jgi:hypothetical protein
VAVRIMCDVCDNVADPSTWLGLTMTIPGEMLGTFTGEELEIHVCSWRCVFILSRDKIGMTPDADVDDGPLVKRDAEEYTAAPVDRDRERIAQELVARNAQAAADAEEAMITWGNNPNAGRKQPDADIPLGGITRDRQTIRLRKA